jgi:transcriptional regulator with XRE-family HTH domain
MHNYNISQSKDKKIYMKNLLSFGDQKTMDTQEEMSLAERVQLVLDEMEGRDHGKKARLARIAGCSGPVVNHWLNGNQTEMNLEHAQRIAKALGYRAGWLLKGTGPRRPGPGESVLLAGLENHVEELNLEEQEMQTDLAVDPENDLYIKVSADELKLITRYRNATRTGKTFIDMASINAPKEIPGKH